MAHWLSADKEKRRNEVSIRGPSTLPSSAATLVSSQSPSSIHLETRVQLEENRNKRWIEDC